MTKIYDCFIFFNEIEILTIRLNELYDVVDYFIICEAKKHFRALINRFILKKIYIYLKNFFKKSFM